MSPGPVGVYACSIILVVAATLAVGCRLGVRASKRIKIGLDDYFMFASLLLLLSLFVVLIIGSDGARSLPIPTDTITGTQRGTIGTHTLQSLQTHQITITWHEQDIAKLEYISQALATICYGTIKISALFLAKRALDDNIFKWTSRVTMTVVSLWTIAFFFAAVFQCDARPAWFWQSPLSLAEHCGHYEDIMLSSAVSDVVLNLVVLIVVMPVIWKLHTSRLQKLGLTVVLLLGYLSTAAAIVRIVIVVNDVYKTTTGAQDIRGDVTNYMICSYIEAALGVIAISLPALQSSTSPQLSDGAIASFYSKKPSIDSIATLVSPSSNPSFLESKSDIRTSTNAAGRGQLYRMTSGTHTVTVEHMPRPSAQRNMSLTEIFVSREFQVHESDE